MSHKNLGFALFLYLPAACLAADTQIDLAQIMKENTHSIELSKGKLVGSGADLIFESAANTQFVALGEEHNNLHIPALTTAIFHELQNRYGYQYFMTEQDPVMMELFSSAPARGNLPEINKLAQSYPYGVTFISDQELEMLANIGKLSEADHDVIWGCDQASGATHVLDQLLLEVDEGTSKQAVLAMREKASAAEAVRNHSANFFIFDVHATEFEDLNKTVNPNLGSHAAWMLDVLIRSSKVFDFYQNGDAGKLPGYYENNRYREELLKDLCLAKYRGIDAIDSQPKVLMKFGSWHLFEGLSPTRIHSIGDFFSNVARFNGTEFLSVFMASAPENTDNLPNHMNPVWPFIKDLNPDEFAVIDLRAFRPYTVRAALRSTMGDEWIDRYRADFDRLVYGYDLVFFVGRTASATFEVVPKAE